MESSTGIRAGCTTTPCPRQLNHLAADGADSLKSFASDVAHEMRTPIGQIQSIAAMLLDQAAPLSETLQSDVPVLWEIEPCMRVHGYKPLVKVVLRNLLGNAVKYSQLTQAPRVEVGLHGVGLRRFVRVRDNGAGFDMAAAARLFQPFSRLHDPSQFGGVGLGLCIVKRIVDFHGGCIAARSAPGAGACFEFSLESAAADCRLPAQAVQS